MRSQDGAYNGTIPEGHYVYRPNRNAPWQLLPCDYWNAEGKLVRVSDPEHPVNASTPESLDRSS